MTLDICEECGEVKCTCINCDCASCVRQECDCIAIEAAIKKASIPNLGALMRAGKATGLIKPVPTY